MAGIVVQTDYKSLDVCCDIGCVSVSIANLGLVANHCYFTHVPCAIDAFGPEAECKALNAKRTWKQVCLAVTETRSERAATAHTSSLRTEPEWCTNPLQQQRSHHLPSL